jgi:hypothetical protein
MFGEKHKSRLRLGGFLKFSSCSLVSVSISVILNIILWKITSFQHPLTAHAFGVLHAVFPIFSFSIFRSACTTLFQVSVHVPSVHTAASTQMTVSWDTVPCNLVKVDRRFRDAYCLHRN